MLTGSWATIKTSDKKKKKVKLRKEKEGEVKKSFFLVVQNKFIASAVGLGQCLKYGEYKTKTKTKINKGKDYKQKKKTNQII